MDTPKNPFRKWSSVEGNNKVKFFLHTFGKNHVHVAIAKSTPGANTLYYINNKFIEAYPMLLEYIGEPSLHCIALVEQWLQNIIVIPAKAFVKNGTFSQIFLSFIVSYGLPI